MSPATHPLAALIGAALLVGGCASAPNAADMTPKPATPTPVNANDGLQPVLIGLAAKKSVDEHRPVKIAEIRAQYGL